MADFARSADPAVQYQLDRLAALSPGGDVLGLDRITRLLGALGDPHRALPPVFHVAGTNGKGSTCAFLRVALEAAGHRVHVYTSPHLVRFNERIRVAGTLISDEALAKVLGEVFDACGEIGPSFFEVTTAAMFLAFARNPADACVIEVGLGGRLDATNVIPAPLVCGIASLGMDHEGFLGNDIVGIAGEKAGIAKRGVPLATDHYAEELAERIGAVAAGVGADWLPRGDRWNVATEGERLLYRDARGAIDLPVPRLPGLHQARNAALAIAMLRHQSSLDVPTTALSAAMDRAEWPARLQRLDTGPLTARLREGTAVWLDGAHNPSAAAAVMDWMRANLPDAEDLVVVMGLLANKDAGGILDQVAGRATRVIAVPVAGHAHHAPEALADAARAARMEASASPDVAAALHRIAQEGGVPAVLIMGSLYLAGVVLAENGQAPA